MTLYARLTLALMGAAAAGGTALVLAATVAVAPALMWGLLLGGMLALTACLARWVLRPLRALAADMADGERPPVDRTLEQLRRAFVTLRGRLAEREGRVEAQVTERVRDLTATHMGLSLLFDAVCGDAPETPDAAFVSGLLSRWVREGPVRAAGVWWSGGARPSFLSAGDTPVRPDRVPRGLLADAERAGHPVLMTGDNLTWLAVAVPAPKADGPNPAPRTMVAAWPAARPPAEAERVTCVALARYLATRSAAHRAATGVRAADTPAPGPRRSAPKVAAGHEDGGP